MVKFLDKGSAISTKTVRKLYNQLRGVDFSTDPSQVNASRSPDACNMIADSGGFPMKRPGWRVLCTIAAPVNGIFHYSGEIYILHGGGNLYRWENGSANEAELLYADINDAKSCAFTYEGKLYILTGREYLIYDGEKIANVSDNAYVPTTTISAPPAGGGTKFQDVNLLTCQRANTFIADGSSTCFYLDTEDATEIISVEINDEVLTSGYSLDSGGGSVTFDDAPAAPATSGVPNVRIVFSKETGDYASRVTKCTIAAVYSNRVFFSGNPDYANADFASGLNDPSYVPDLSYTEIGYDNAAIMGYLRLGDALAIVKADDSQDASIFLRTVQLDDDDVIFPVTQGVAGAGAASKYGFVSLVDDPLFISRSGVYAIGTQLVTLERTLQTRSGLVNARLTQEDLSTACAVEWNGFYVLSVGGHGYLADSRQKSRLNNITGTYEYEWYYWDNFPARVLLAHEGDLFWGTAEGQICRLNNDMSNGRGGLLMNAYNDDGKAISAWWSTPKDADGSFMTYKTLQKKGCGIYLKTYTHSSVQVNIITDHDFGQIVKKANVGILDFGEIDFADFTFNTLPENIIGFGRKIKKYKTIQIVVSNSVLNEGFGLYAIERKFVYNNSVK